MGAQEAAAHCTLGRVGEAEQCHGHRYPHAMVMSMPKVNESDEKCHVFFRAVQVLRQLQVELSCWSFCGVMSFDARTQSGSEFSEGCHFGWAKGFIPALATLAWFGAKIDFEITWLNPFGIFPDAVEADFGGPRSTFSASCLDLRKAKWWRKSWATSLARAMSLRHNRKWLKPGTKSAWPCQAWKSCTGSKWGWEVAMFGAHVWDKHMK